MSLFSLYDSLNFKAKVSVSRPVSYRIEKRIMIFHPIIELKNRFPLKAAIIAKLSPCSRRLIQ